MALPFPELHRPGSAKDRKAFRTPRKLALNALTLVLSWLYLGQPALARPCLGLELGAPLNARQLAVIENLAIGVDRWNAEGPLGPEEMARGAAKVEALEALLAALTEQFAAPPHGSPPIGL